MVKKNINVGFSKKFDIFWIDSPTSIVLICTLENGLAVGNEFSILKTDVLLFCENIQRYHNM